MDCKECNNRKRILVGYPMPTEWVPCPSCSKPTEESDKTFPLPGGVTLTQQMLTLAKSHHVCGGLIPRYNCPSCLMERAASAIDAMMHSMNGDFS